MEVNKLYEDQMSDMQQAADAWNKKMASDEEQAKIRSTADFSQALTKAVTKRYGLFGKEKYNRAKAYKDVIINFANNIH